MVSSGDCLQCGCTVSGGEMSAAHVVLGEYGLGVCGLSHWISISALRIIGTTAVTFGLH